MSERLKLYIVQQGDWLASIGRKFGVHWERIYNHPKNKTFKEKYPDPNVIRPGQELWIPEPLSVKVLPKRLHPGRQVIRVRLFPKEKIEILFRDEEGNPLADETYKFKIGGYEKEGRTDGEGRLKEEIESEYLKYDGYKIFIRGHELPLKIGHLDPVGEPKGIQARLKNLGYYSGKIDGMIRSVTKEAIRGFQKDYGLKEDGIAGPKTQNRLVEVHGSGETNRQTMKRTRNGDGFDPSLLVAANTINTIVLGTGVMVFSMKDGIENEYVGSGLELKVKEVEGSGGVSRIFYRVCGQDQRVSVWIEYDSSSSIHGDFYRSKTGDGFSPPRLALLMEDEPRTPGEYEVKWDGRDETTDSRILLAGEYKIKIEGIDPEGKKREGEATFRVARSTAWNFGIDYDEIKHDKDGNEYEVPHSTRIEVEHAERKQKTLKDGTGFNATSQLKNRAGEAVDLIQKAGVVYWSGHSNPHTVVFYDGEGGRVNESKKTRLRLYRSECGSGDIAIEELKPNSFNDLFLLVLAGCLTANEKIWVVQHKLLELSKDFDPGKIDGKHGPRTTRALQEWQEWEKIEPGDGKKNDETLKKIRIYPIGQSEEELTRMVQEKLEEFSRRYYPGPSSKRHPKPGEEEWGPDGIYNAETKKAIQNYQEDHPPLVASGKPDDAPTLESLGLKPEDLRNIAQEVVRLGCNIAFGFQKKVGLIECEDMMIAFWDYLAQGMGVEKAARKAWEDQKEDPNLKFKIYYRDGVSPNSTLHPARYGKSE